IGPTRGWRGEITPSDDVFVGGGWTTVDILCWSSGIRRRCALRDADVARRHPLPGGGRDAGNHFCLGETCRAARVVVTPGQCPTPFVRAAKNVKMLRRPALQRRRRLDIVTIYRL